MKPFLMGSETEFSVSGVGPQGAMLREDVFRILNDSLRQERRWVQDVAGAWGAYYEHGGRLYLDSGGHPEHATPECQTPVQVAAYDKAAERLLDMARARARAQYPDRILTVVKNNVSPLDPDETTWGCHESYTCWGRVDRAAVALVPHLVSRLVYAGAGCLSGRDGGVGFELSQRARHLRVVVGNETTANRPLFCTRIRKQSDHDSRGWVRVHLIAKDSQRAPFGTYLTLGTTGLLFLLFNEGRKLGQGVALADPLKAAQSISLDPWMKGRVPLQDGRMLTALEIQDVYFAECEKAAATTSLPAWVPELLHHWRTTLDTLRRDPLDAADRLDAPCKAVIYNHELGRAGYSWGQLHQALATLSKLRHNYTPRVVRALLADTALSLTFDERAQLARASLEARVTREGVLDRLRFAVRLQALELNYHEIGGLHDRLAESGQFRSVVLTSSEIDRATREAPPGGRAALRSAAIKAAKEDGWVADWRYLFHAGSRLLIDMRDPFDGNERRTNLSQVMAGGRPDFELVQHLMEMND